MNSKNRELFNADLKTNVSAEDLVLMPPTELFDEAKAIALRTKSDEKYPFFLQYDSNQKDFLLSMLQTSGAIVEGDDEKGHTLATSMNMAQLAFIKRLDCVERVKTDEGINSFLIEEAVKPEPIRTNPPKSGTTATGQAAEVEQITQTTAFTVGDFATSAANADVISGEEEPVDGTAVASVAASPRSSSCSCPTNTDMASAQEISVETLVSGCICCPGTTQWFKFTAPQTKRYTIFTSGSLDTVGTLSGSCLSEPITNDDCAGKINFRIVENLCAGSTYYIQVGAKNDATGSYTLQVTAQILAEKVTVSSTNENGVIVLEQGKTYELPRGEGFGFFNIPNTVNAPISVDVAPDDTTDKRVYWYASSISNNTVSTDFDFYDNTTKYQTITANAVGGAKLLAYDRYERGKAGTAYVAVIPNGGSLVRAARISLDTTSLTLNIGEYRKITATVFPTNATVQNVEWVSSNPNIATVSQYGRVTAVAPGTATIFAMSMDGLPTVKASCTVNVKGFYNLVNSATGKVANIKGSYLFSVSNENDITLYSKSGSNEQIWRIETISDQEDCYIKSYIDQAYGFNAFRSPNHNYNCNIHKIAGNETDAAVHFVLQPDGCYKIELAKHAGYYLTATGSNDGDDIRWQTADRGEFQHWQLVYFDVAQREAEKTEYHMIPYSDINLEEQKRALQVNMQSSANKTLRLANDEPLELATFSYVNKQKWRIKGTGSERKIYTSNGDNYCLCRKNDNTVYVSNNSSYESNITVVDYNTSQNLVKIKLSQSNLYLTASDSGIVWSSLAADSTNQVWQLAKKPDNIHNGADTSASLYDSSVTDKGRTIRAYKLGGEEFVARYYADANEILHVEKILSKSEAESLHTHGIKIVSVYQDSADDVSYFNEATGEQDAEAALSLATKHDQPAGSAIYFAVDYNAIADHMDNIKAYFSAVKSVFDNADRKYKIGVYGNGLVCSTIKGLYADFSWLSAAPKHTGSSEYDSPEEYNIRQAEKIRYNGIDFDDCIAVDDKYGQW